MTTTYPATPDGQAAAFATPFPRTIAYSAEGIVVTTGDAVLEPSVLEKIRALEAAEPITHRNLRDLALSVAQIAAFITGANMEDNPAVKQILEFEARVAALRAGL